MFQYVYRLGKQRQSYYSMVATKAFGLGIDYPEMRLVIHYGSPSTSMDFAQETGRAGRDDKFSIAAMFYRKHEVTTSAYIDVRMKNFVEDKSMCVRSFLASEMDGQCSGCDFMPDYVVCFRCNPGLLDEIKILIMKSWSE
ncbi:hypothetical protein SPOG_05487 [Schizosaccharomyces cryophilus OY26]|uniref:DNA 3'-5' helicase n=1 Tax=Schizosaccharomyces cryophilus (strain OY26 / ATCC MYA-4695 / CBS 11777 / NBRC 106824 / NRRL Y48691) TaxID=653667 RepID=S9W396_SCHCR|nr:uncharacterized protein SPOG_05487 [Schizosaccharomyces cryophilus OY26]EPY53029.1 hypothetical protein SPOG_05487 [Schizosaccharomyces cryophilus OY26]